MKQGIALLLVCFVMLIAFVGCTTADFALPFSAEKVGWEDTRTVLLNEEAQEKIANLLNDAVWVDDVTNCAADYEFLFSDRTVRYHSSCGTMIDMKEGRSVKLSDAEKSIVNDLLGVKAFMPSAATASLNILQFHPSGYGVSVKRIKDSALAKELLEALTRLAETGEIIPKISDEEVSLQSGFLPVERGTKWIEASVLYRIDPEMETICRVETHLGEGIVLQMDENVRKLFCDLWYYEPYHVELGTYKNGVLSLNHVYTAPSNVDIHVKEMEVRGGHADAGGRIVLELHSFAEQKMTVRLFSQQSDDNLAEGDAEEVIMSKGETKTIALTFGGFPYTYDLTIQADNTQLRITVIP